MSNRTKSNRRKNRQGSVVPLIAVLLPVFVALIAFAVDYGAIVVSRHELQNAADAAAVATLQTLNSSYNKADLAADETLSANLFHGKPVTYDMMLDVEYGTWNAEDRSFSKIDREGTVSSSGDTSGDTIPGGASAVRIKLTRSVERKNGVRLFFGTILGKSFADIHVEAIASSSGGCTGFVGVDSVRLHNRAITDSYNSDEGSYGSASIYQNGDVCTDGELLLDYSAVEIRGDAEGSPITIRNGSNNKITGSQSAPSGTRSYDPVDFSTTQNNNDNNTIPERPPYDYRGQYYVDSNNDFILDGGQQLTLSPGTYHFRNMTVEGGARLTIDGDVTIYIEKKMQFDNGTSANPNSDPIQLQLNVGQGPVNIKGGHDLHAALYAPEADVTIDNNAQFYGSIIGETLTAGGGAKLHYDESLRSSDAPSSAPPSLVN